MKIFCWQKSCIIIPPFRFLPTPPFKFEWQTDGIFPKVKYYDKLNVGQWREKANCCTCSAAANWTWTENPLKCVFNFVLRTRETPLFIFQFWNVYTKFRAVKSDFIEIAFQQIFNQLQDFTSDLCSSSIILLLWKIELRSKVKTNEMTQFFQEMKLNTFFHL